MSIRPAENAQPPRPNRLLRVPQVPKGLSREEVAVWLELARAAVALGTLSTADLPLLARTAKVTARADALLDDPTVKPSELASILSLCERLLRAFGLSPLARRGVAPLPKRKTSAKDSLADF